MDRRYRTYSELAEPDRSDLPGQIAGQLARVRLGLAEVERVVAVMSGKGGVGKSLLSAALSVSLRDGGVRTGLLDGDLHGPTAARMCGADRQPLRVAGDRVHPATGAAEVAVMSTDLLLAEGAPLSWRGPREDGFVWEGPEERTVLREFLGDVAWGRLGWLIVDLPPGTRRMIDLFELVPDLTGLVVVTLPAGAAGAAAERAVRLARERAIPVLGVVENMAGYHCPSCGADRPLFAGEAGRELAEGHGLPLLGRVPFDPEAAALVERGALPEMLERTQCGQAVRDVARRLRDWVEAA